MTYARYARNYVKATVSGKETTIAKLTDNELLEEIEATTSQMVARKLQNKVDYGLRARLAWLTNELSYRQTNIDNSNGESTII